MSNFSLLSLLSMTMVVLACSPVQTGALERLNGFDLRDVQVPPEEIFHGGPARDGIPAIDSPQFVTADSADWLKPDERVLGLSLQGTSRAYPVAILNWHEIVNDRFGERAVVVTFCPLCGSGMAFAAEVDGQALSFGVSGLLYNNDMLLYDRQSKSLWSQLMRQAISGPMRGRRLQMLALQHTSWQEWRDRHPQTQVLSRETGFARDYSRDPYAGYAQESELFFPLSAINPRYHPKEQVLGLEIDGAFKAYPFQELSRLEGVLNDRLGNRPIRVHFDKANATAWVESRKGRRLPSVISYWFAWMAFHPDSLVFEGD